MIDYQELVKSLSDENITKRAHDAALEQISQKVNEIWRHICKVSKRKLDWWAFSNDVSLGRGNGSTGGNFDPENDAEFIEITGENSFHKSDFYEYNGGFPTSFLWEDYETIVAQHLKDVEKKEKEKKQKEVKKTMDKKAVVETLKSKLKSILTKEEFKLISFKG